MSTDIKACTSDNIYGDVVVCNDQDVADIKICEDECKTASIPVVSGDADCNVGDIYIASGGLEPYVWSFDSGSISQSGEILTINDCGDPGETRAGTVSVKDRCGKTGGLVVRLPSGVWSTPVTHTTTALSCTGTSFFPSSSLGAILAVPVTCCVSPGIYTIGWQASAVFTDATTTTCGAVCTTISGRYRAQESNPTYYAKQGGSDINPPPLGYFALDKFNSTPTIHSVSAGSYVGFECLYRCDNPFPGTDPGACDYPGAAIPVSLKMFLTQDLSEWVCPTP